jgi:EAL domain-containing protein (putative c-di-GMP-specific phosphodiesterase class I)
VLITRARDGAPFVQQVKRRDGDTLIASMIAMAHALGMKVVAEDVATVRQVQLLKMPGHDEGQAPGMEAPGQISSVKE